SAKGSRRVGVHARSIPGWRQSAPFAASLSVHGRELKPFGSDPPHPRRNPAKAQAPAFQKGGRIMKRALIFSLIMICCTPTAFAKGEGQTTHAQVVYPAFVSLTDDVAVYRQSRLITLEQFQAMARESGTLILDARSPAAYARGHIEGAVNIPF